LGMIALIAAMIPSDKWIAEFDDAGCKPELK
jgi:hypothetical protein